MGDLTSHDIVAAAFSYSEKGRHRGLPAPPGPIFAAVAPATVERKAVDKIVENALSATPSVGKGLAKSYKLGLSSLKLAAALGDPDSSLRARAGAAIDVSGDLFSLTREVARPLRDNAIFQTIGHGLTACALICDLWDAATEKPEPLFGIRSVS